MKRLLLSLSLLFALVAPGCLSPAAQQEVLFPVAVSAFDGIQTDILYAIDPLEASDSDLTLFKVALASHDTVQLALYGPLWFDTLRPLAEQGIAQRVTDGLIGPGVAESLRERLESFEDALIALGVPDGSP